MRPIEISERSNKLRVSFYFSRRLLIFSKALILVYINEYNSERDLKRASWFRRKSPKINILMNLQTCDPYIHLFVF